jgi:peptide/nickel transport system substrate-binding protein
MLKRVLAAIGLALVVVCGLSAGLAEAAEAPPGSIRVGVGQGLVNPDPHTCTLYSDVRVLEQVYDGLLRIDPATLKPEPALAESYQISPDQLTWTFRLRPGVQFHDGRPLTAADVKYSIDRIRDPKTGATLRSDYDPVADVAAPDPLTVVLKLRRPFGVLAQVLATPVWSAIVPKAATDLAGKPDGTGPFAFIGQVPKTSVSLARNDHFYRTGLPKATGVQFIVIPDESARVAALQSHQVDIIDTVALPLARTLQSDAGVRLIKTDSAWVDEFGFNAARKPFDDPRVRRAIAMAINKPQVTAAATFGLGKPAVTMVSASPIALQVAPLPYDPAAAKKLLAEAGVSTLSFSFSACGGTAFPQMIRAGEVIAADLKAIGVDAKLTSLEASVWVDQVINKHDYAAFVCGLVNGTDPDQKTFRYFTTTGAYNFSQYRPSPALETMMEQARESADPAERGRLYSQIWTQLLQDSPWVPLYVMPGLVGIADKVQGFVTTPDSDLVLTDVSLAP